MADMKKVLSAKEIKIWDSATKCSCGDKNCETKHRLCSICDLVMIAENVHKGNGNYDEKSWGVHYIIPESKIVKLAYWANLRGIVQLNDSNNLQAIHTVCNDIKGDKFENRYSNGYNK